MHLMLLQNFPALIAAFDSANSSAGAAGGVLRSLGGTSHRQQPNCAGLPVAENAHRRPRQKSPAAVATTGASLFAAGGSCCLRDESRADERRLVGLGDFPAGKNTDPFAS